MVHIIKIYFENFKKEQEIRRLAVTSEVVSNFGYLLERIQNVFQLPNAANLQIKWRDPENDFILMSSNDELAQALANAEEGLLRLYVYCKSEASGNTNIPKSPSSKVSGDVHPFVVCDGCDGRIVGDRYKCLQCRNYDLCASCEAANKHPDHDMIKFVKPTYVPREWVFLGARKMWRSMFSAHNANVNLLHSLNTVPKSAPSCSTAPDASSAEQQHQPKEKSAPNAHSTQEQSKCDFSNFPNAFINCLQNDFVDAPKLLHQGLNQVLKAVQGTIEIVDHNIYNPEFRRNQGNGNNTASATPPPQTTQSPTVETPSAAVPPTPAPEVVSPPTPTTTENAPIVNVISDNDKSTQNDAAATGETVEEIIIDSDSDRSNTAEESAADGWTLLEGGDANKMECGEAVVANAPDKPTQVAYPDLMEFEPNQEGNNGQTVGQNQEINNGHVVTTDPAIVDALQTMRSMGFTNEGGWLERLLISKQGNISEALEALYPSIHHQ